MTANHIAITPTRAAVDGADITARRPRDARTFWRVLLAVVAPAAGIILAVTSLVDPAELGGSSDNLVRSYAAHRSLVQAAAWLGTLLGATMVPGAVAVAWVCRRRRPVFAAVAGFMVVVGFLSGSAYGNMQNLVALVGVQEGIDHATLITLLDGIGNTAVIGVALVPMLLAITVGRILLGVLLWRAAVAPRWMAVALIAAPFVEFINITGSNVQPAIGWALTAVGFASTTVALLRTNNDDFDLPPIPPPSSPSSAEVAVPLRTD